jgi:hypothetical protein
MLGRTVIPVFVGWVERSETHQFAGTRQMMGFALLNPSYDYYDYDVR